MAISSKKDPPTTCFMHFQLISKCFSLILRIDAERVNCDHAASLDLLLLVKDKPQSSKEGAEDDANQGGHHEEHHLERDHM